MINSFGVFVIKGFTVYRYCPPVLRKEKESYDIGISPSSQRGKGKLLYRYSPPVLREEKGKCYIGIPLQFSERKRKVAIYVFPSSSQKGKGKLLYRYSPPVLRKEKESCCICIPPSSRRGKGKMLYMYNIDKRNCDLKSSKNWEVVDKYIQGYTHTEDKTLCEIGLVRFLQGNGSFLG